MFGVMDNILNTIDIYCGQFRCVLMQRNQGESWNPADGLGEPGVETVVRMPYQVAWFSDTPWSCFGEDILCYILLMFLNKFD